MTTSAFVKGAARWYSSAANAAATNREFRRRLCERTAHGRPIRPEERDIVLEYYRVERPAWFALVCTLFFTGMRPGELAASRVDDVDLGRVSLPEASRVPKSMSAETTIRSSAAPLP